MSVLARARPVGLHVGDRSQAHYGRSIRILGKSLLLLAMPVNHVGKVHCKKASCGSENSGR